MRKYEVTQACYIPVGTGFKYKLPGQLVQLSAEDAAELGDLVVAVPDRVQILNTLRVPGTTGTPLDGVQELNTLAPAAAEAVESVQKLNTPKESKKSKATDVVEASPEEVVDAGEPGAADERVAAENRE